MLTILREDFRRYLRPWHNVPRWQAVPRALLTYGFLAVCVYRYGRWMRTLPRALAIPLKVIYYLLKVPTELLLGIHISLDSNIGPGLYIGHFGGIFLVGDAGRNLSVGQGVTIGYKGAGKSRGLPVLGDNVYVGVGAKIIGDIRIGDDVVIGANTVVTKNIPPRTRVVGAAVRMASLDDLDTAPPTRETPALVSVPSPARTHEETATTHEVATSEKRASGPRSP